MSYGFEKKWDIIVRMVLLLYAAIMGAVAFMIAREWFPEMTFHKISELLPTLFILLLVAVSLSSLYFALFFDRIMQKRKLRELARKRERLAQLVCERDDRIQNPIDTSTLILLDNLTDYDTLENCILDNLNDNDEESLENLPLLWKRGEGSYAITFPCGVTRQALCQLVDDIWCFCSCNVQAWSVPELFKKHTGEWIYLCHGQDDFLIALDEDETQWNINPEDSMLYRSQRHDCFYKARPEIELARLERVIL